MSEHRLNIEVQELAQAFKDLRGTIDLIEHIIYKSLLKEADNDGEHVTTNSES